MVCGWGYVTVQESADGVAAGTQESTCTEGTASCSSLVGITERSPLSITEATRDTAGRAGIR
jgi:hypothetical protein